MATVGKDWLALSRLLDQALSLPPGDRAAWVAGLVTEPEPLKDLLRDLLSRDDLVETQGFLGTLPKLTSTEWPALAAVSAGEMFGPYRLERELGMGGMGSVWLAERADGLLRRKVALKLPHVGLALPGLAERIASERNILAGLEHPNIARLYDAGVAADGRPYLALEYIDGEAVDKYCERHQLDVRERVRVIVEVARAVAYAHAHLVVHRDLKPSNIQVDAQGHVHLLDFGIAKLLEPGAQGTAAVTQLAARALTPEYASPEQIRGETVSTASDVYSLGVVLCELLTGTRPYRLKRGADNLSLVQEIVSGEPGRPSDAATTPAARRTLRGDLDTIILKALKKDPRERYATVAEFADDLERWLRGEAVRVRADSAWYRTRKFVRRNRVMVSAAAAVVVALAAGLTVAAWQAHVARLNAANAEREAQRARVVQSFLTDLFNANTDAQSDPVRARQTTARELLDRGAARVHAALKDSPEAEDEVLDTLSDMYRAVGADDQVATMDRERVELRERLYGPRDWHVAEALLAYSGGIEATSDRLKGPALVQRAKEIIDASPTAPAVLRMRVLMESSRVSFYVNITRMRDDAHAARHLIEQFHIPTTDELGTLLRFEARANTWLGAWDAAVSLHEQSLAEARKLAPAAVDLIVSDLVELADARDRMAQVPEAEAIYRRALQFSRERNGASHVDTIHVQIRLAALLHKTSRGREARELEQDALSQAARGTDTDTPNLISQIQRSIGTSLLDEGQPAAAAPYVVKRVELARQLYPGGTVLATALYDQSRLELAFGHYASADQLLDEAWRMSRTALGSARLPVTDNPFLLLRAQLRIAEGRAADAIADLKTVIATEVPLGTRLKTDEIAARAWLAAAALQLHDAAGALESAGTALRAVQGSAVRAFYQSLEADAALGLGQAKLMHGDPEGARQLLEHALALRQANQLPGSRDVVEASRALADCLARLTPPRRK